MGIQICWIGSGYSEEVLAFGMLHRFDILIEMIAKIPSYSSDPLPSLPINFRQK